MLVIAGFGMLVMVLSAMMVASPVKWSRGILAFSRKSYFHFTEILSRLALGLLLLLFADGSSHAWLFSSLGYLFIGVAIGLTVIGERKHRAFAERSATFTNVFRPGGCIGLALGAFMIYSALA